jgi:hypothetical protein
MPRIRYLLGLALLLWPCPAMAQPLFRFEHNWTVMIDGHRYGLLEVVQIPGDSRWTEVWIGPYRFKTEYRLAAMVTEVVQPSVKLILGYWRLPDGPRRRHAADPTGE